MISPFTNNTSCALSDHLTFEMPEYQLLKTVMLVETAMIFQERKIQVVRPFTIMACGGLNCALGDPSAFKNAEISNVATGKAMRDSNDILGKLTH